MASEHPGDTSVSVTLPESLSRWLDDKARDEGRSREDVLLELLSTYQQVAGPDGGEGDDGEVTLPPGLDEELGRLVDGRLEAGLEDRLDERLATVVDERVDDRLAAAVDERVDDRLGEVDDGSSGVAGVAAEELDRRLDGLESRFMGLLQDVRERVVEVKREADAKAPADHGHPEQEQVRADLSGVEAAVDDLAERVGSLDDRLEAGFDNYEEVLEYLADAVDRVSARQTTLARALVETREELRKLAARDTARSAAEDLKRRANRAGVRTAVCEDCESPVDVGLLTRAECPNCSASFVGIEPSSGFFGSNRLEVGERPALEPGASPHESFEFGVSQIIEDDEGERPWVGPQGAAEEGEER